MPKGMKEKLKSSFRRNKKKDDMKNESSDPFERDGMKVVKSSAYEPRGATVEEAFNTLGQKEEKETEKSTEKTQEAPTEKSTQEVQGEPLTNELEIVAGMPTVESVKNMAGGVSDKIKKHKSFAKALEALGNYHEAMQKQQTVKMNVVAQFRGHRASSEIAQLNIGEEAAHRAFEAMREFILNADRAVHSGYFAKRSTNVQRLIPVFANLLVKAYDILPKLAHLEYEVSQYVMATDKESFTYAEILDHQVIAGRSGGYAMQGTENSNGAFILNPQKALEALKDEEGSAEDNILALRKEATVQARMNMVIPSFPVGALKVLSEEAVDGDKKQALEESREKIINQYIEELKTLMRALDDTVESHEGGTKDRMGVHDKQAEHFRLSKLFYRLIQNKELLSGLLVQGLPKEATSEYQDILRLCSLGGSTLSEAVAMMNQAARDASILTRLTDKEGNALQEGKDYKVGGGGASISILDFQNQRVLRAPKEDNQYLSQEKQNTALNGINDEATGKVAQFLGFNVVAQAEAAGFMAKEAGGTEEIAVFGGSIMEMAKGVTAANINSIMSDNLTGVAEKRKNRESVNIMKNGRFIKDMMKMNIVDYIVAHGDRSQNNYMINLEAGEGESMITAIDNDMVFGYDDTSGRHIGYSNSKDALLGINNRVLLDQGITVNSVLPMIPKDIKNTIEGIDLEALNQMLMPYVDRVARMAAVHRAAELKEWVKKVPECDLDTEEGIAIFINQAAKNSMTDWIKGMTIGSNKETFGMSVRDLPSTLMRMLMHTYGFINFAWGKDEDTIGFMKKLGLSKEEVEQLLLENLSKSKDADIALTKEELYKTNLGKELEKQYS